MNYPYYIITWQEGKLPCPPQYRGTVIQRQFDKGHIGGRRNVEKRVTTPQEALRIFNQDRTQRTVYEVKSPQTQRRRLRYEELQRLVREAEEEKRKGK